LRFCVGQLSDLFGEVYKETTDVTWNPSFSSLTEYLSDFCSLFDGVSTAAHRDNIPAHT
jgi:hypothetical protein